MVSIIISKCSVISLAQSMLMQNWSELCGACACTLVFIDLRSTRPGCVRANLEQEQGNLSSYMN
jgi:hypothetical protein